MGKITIEQKSKLMISRDKFCDDDFDKLVIETSHSVALKSLEAMRNPPPQVSQNLDTPHQKANSDVNSAIETCEHSILNQPKRPMNAFMVWGQAIRRELHHKFSNVQNALLSKALGRVWRSLNATEKEPFVRRANLIKANHKRDYPNYRYQPRRMQERRARNNMLIGINLNHPVNQLQNQQSAIHLSDQPSVANYQTSGSLVEYRNHPIEDDNKKGRSSMTRSLMEESRVSSLPKDMVDGVQTFQYHPYPAPPIEATIDCNNCRPIISGGSQNDANYRDGQLQTSIYPSYQQFAYNNMHQSQHHHSQQSHYHQQNIAQQSYETLQQQCVQLDQSSNGLQLTSNNTGFYYTGR